MNEPKLTEEYLDALTHRKVIMAELIVFDECKECGDKLDHDCLDNACGRIRVEASEAIKKCKAEKTDCGCNCGNCPCCWARDDEKRGRAPGVSPEDSD